MAGAIHQDRVELGVPQRHRENCDDKHDPSHRIAWVLPSNQEPHGGKCEGDNDVCTWEPEHPRIYTRSPPDHFGRVEAVPSREATTL